MMSVVAIEPLRKTFRPPAPARRAAATIPDWAQQPLFLSPDAAAVWTPPRRRASAIRSLLRRFMAWIENARVRPVPCPISGAAHRIDTPVTMTGGQGRPWKLFGRCSLCGQVATAHKTPQ